MKNGCNSKSPASDRTGGHVRGDDTKMKSSNKSMKPGYELGNSNDDAGALSKGYTPMGKFEAGSDGMKSD